jgi:hypothetical protein
MFLRNFSETQPEQKRNTDNRHGASRQDIEKGVNDAERCFVSFVDCLWHRYSEQITAPPATIKCLQRD